MSTELATTPLEQLTDALWTPNGNLALIEDLMRQVGPMEPAPVVHRFTHDTAGKVNLYMREIHMAAGTLVTSKRHKTEHPYVMSKGRVSVWTEEAGVVQLQAPHSGITKPGTKRLIYVHEDTVWATFHPTDTDDLEQVELQVIQPDEPLKLNQGNLWHGGQ